MISLTTPISIKSVLGGTATVSYDKMVISPFVLDAIARTVRGSLVLTSTANPAMQPLIGTLVVTIPATGNSILETSVPQLDFYRKITLTSAQKTALLLIITDAQDSLESGLISLGLIAGAQSTGS